MTLQRRHAGRSVVVLAAVLWTTTAIVNRSLRRVTGPSMHPTLRDGDLVLTVPVRRPAVGHVVVARDPRGGPAWVKRVGAVGPARHDGVGATIAVAPGQVLLLGDNPAASTDGRVLGPTPVGDVQRRVVLQVASGGRPKVRLVRNRDATLGV